MKKKIILVTLLSFVLVLSACGQGNEKEGKKLKEVAVKADFVQYDYQKLKEQAKLIVKVKVEDELSEANSVVKKDPDDEEAFIAAFSKRNIKLLKIYGGKDQDKVEQGGKMTILDNAAISGENYIRTEGYEKLEKDKEYLLFLDNNTESGDYSIISADNGKVDFAALKQGSDKYLDIAVKALSEFEANTEPNELKKILKAEVSKNTGLEGTGKEKKSISLKAVGLTLNYVWETADKILVKFE